MKMTVRLLAGVLAASLSPSPAWSQEGTDAASPPPAAATSEATSEAIAAAPTEATHALAGYRNYDALTSELSELAQSPMAELESLGTTLQGRELWLLTVAADPAQTKPAILVVGNVEAPHVLGSELAVRMAKQLLEQADSDEAMKNFLSAYTLYFIPSPSPDATEKNFTLGSREHAGNSVATDDDRDFSFGEDPPVDLDGNGFVTMMRIEDSLGTHRVHPEDPRVMIAIDPKKNEMATHRLLVEAKDHDGDELMGEDGGDGVDINRNFTFNYEYFSKNAGVNQVSEIETRALVDFCFEHPNIAVVLSFSHQDNLFHPWKSSSSGESARIKTSILSADVPYTNYLSDRFKELHSGKNPPDATSQAGAFVDWAYFHYGRWSFASRGWWIPEVKAAAAAEVAAAEVVAAAASAEPAEAAAPAPVESADKKKEPADKKKEPGEKRGQDQLNALRWLASQSTTGFADWVTVDHPDFAGKVVEVGGFLPFVRTQPPEKLIADLVKPHVDFVVSLGGLLPKIEFREVKVKALGRDFFEIEVDLVNTAYMPTMSEMGSVNGEAYPIVVQFELPEDAKLIQGERKTLVRKLDGQGGKRSLKWLVRFADASAGWQLPLTASAPTIPATNTTIEIKQ